MKNLIIDDFSIKKGTGYRYIDFSLYTSYPLEHKIESITWLLSEGWKGYDQPFIDFGYYGDIDDVYITFKMDEEEFKAKYPYIK